MFLNGINSEHLLLSLVFLWNELVFTHLGFFKYLCSQRTNFPDNSYELDIQQYIYIIQNSK